MPVTAHRKVRVAADADLGHGHETSIPTIAVHEIWGFPGIREQFSHLGLGKWSAIRKLALQISVVCLIRAKSGFLAEHQLHSYCFAGKNRETIKDKLGEAVITGDQVVGTDRVVLPMCQGRDEEEGE